MYQVSAQGVDEHMINVHYYYYYYYMVWKTQTATRVTQEGLAPLLDLLFRHKLSSGGGSIWRQQRQHHWGFRTCQKKKNCCSTRQQCKCTLGMGSVGGWVGAVCTLLIWMSFGSFRLWEPACMCCVYLALWTCKLLCAIKKKSFIHKLASIRGYWHCH